MSECGCVCLCARLCACAVALQFEARNGVYPFKQLTDCATGTQNTETKTKQKSNDIKERQQGTPGHRHTQKRSGATIPFGATLNTRAFAFRFFRRAVQQT